MDNLSTRCKEAADRIRETAQDIAFTNISSKYEVKKLLKEIIAHDVDE